MECPECGAYRELLLALHTYERAEPEFCFGPGAGPDGALNFWVCPGDVRHPLEVNTD